MKAALVVGLALMPFTVLADREKENPDAGKSKEELLEELTFQRKLVQRRVGQIKALEEELQETQAELAAFKNKNAELTATVVNERAKNIQLNRALAKSEAETADLRAQLKRR